MHENARPERVTTSRLRSLIVIGGFMAAVIVVKLMPTPSTEPAVNSGLCDRLNSDEELLGVALIDPNGGRSGSGCGVLVSRLSRHESTGKKRHHVVFARTLNIVFKETHHDDHFVRRLSGYRSPACPHREWLRRQPYQGRTKTSKLRSVASGEETRRRHCRAWRRPG